ncbi:MAG: N-glycosylase/DNA lyase [Candidatus Omnitrophota bacterium]|nr:N-glycosylase/DNA lyase [Candidatus Omnitrophota bacterium]
MGDTKTETDNLVQLKKLYKIRRQEILKRLGHFKKVWNKNDKKIFSELCFCILTPQSKAMVCNEIINKLIRNQLLFKGNINNIMPYLKKARFYKNKSKYIIEAREFFKNSDNIRIKDKLDVKNIITTRDWLVENIKGIGYKEASHFLRNIGFGENLAILDIHILKNLKKFGITKKPPKSITKKIYLDIENKFREFSIKIKIPLAHLDLLFWSMETGKIFK